MKAAHCKLASLPSQESISTFKQENHKYYTFWLIKCMSDIRLSGCVLLRLVI